MQGYAVELLTPDGRAREPREFDGECVAASAGVYAPDYGAYLWTTKPAEQTLTFLAVMHAAPVRVVRVDIGEDGC